MTKWGLFYAHKADAFAATAKWKADAMEIIPRLPAKGLIVDFACNTGRFIGYAQAVCPGAHFLGIDVNLFGLSIAGDRYSADFKEGLAGVHNVDYVACLHGLPQFEDAQQTLSEIWEAMKPGAKISVVIHNRLNDLLWAVPNLFTGYKSDQTITKDYSLNELKVVMKDAGFLCDSCHSYGNALPELFKPRLVFHGRKPA